VNNILSPFFAELTAEEGLCGVYQQYCAPANTAHKAMQEVLGDCNLPWSVTHTLHLFTIFCLLLWKSVKDKVYKINPQTLEELRNNTCHEI
jgi:hypothetical protein